MLTESTAFFDWEDQVHAEQKEEKRRKATHIAEKDREERAFRMPQGKLRPSMAPHRSSSPPQPKATGRRLSTPSPPRGRCVSPRCVTQRPSGGAGDRIATAEEWPAEMSTWKTNEETENE